MPRLLSDDLNEVILSDRISGSEITLSYRMPTTEERINYSNRQINRMGTKMVSAFGEVRQEYGAEILQGFKGGDFATKDGPISSDPKSKKYNPKWKELVKKHAPDIIAALAIFVFERSVTLGNKEGGEAPF